MRSRVVLAGMLSFGLATTPAEAVVGGHDVPAGQRSYVANVDIAGSFGCTGTLIAPSWVLTAGHCGSLTGSLSAGLVPTPVAWPASFYGITLGTVQADGAGGEDHAVQRVVVDSDYIVTNGVGNDVTLLQLDRPSSIAPVQIAALSERDAWKPGTLADVAGFGTTSENAGGPPPRMQEAQVPIVDDATCANAYPNGLSSIADDGSFDPASMVCAGYPQGGTDTCEGDSGGPLLVPAPAGLRLIGATSFGAGCARAGKPGVYARLAEGPIRAFLERFVPDAFAPEHAVPPATAKSTAPRPKAKHKAKAKHKRHSKKKSRKHRRKRR